ncbi:ABC transporter permease subunit [Paenibacillus sp. GP183]|uniref:ABC transporter permease subunit n=1 Tax=Paenibacillus sp. GP183 TaxID=1882751 RepID=UPI001C0C692F
MLISYFRAIPESLEEAALIDGCTSLQSLYKIILPIAAPGIAVVATFAFTMAWNVICTHSSLQPARQSKP